MKVTNFKEMRLTIFVRNFFLIYYCRNIKIIILLVSFSKTEVAKPAFKRQACTFWNSKRASLTGHEEAQVTCFRICSERQITWLVSVQTPPRPRKQQKTFFKVNETQDTWAKHEKR